MNYLEPSDILRKGKWVEITPGKIPVKTSFVQKPKTGRRKGQSILTSRTQMVLPDKALSGEYEIDFERLDLEGLSFPTPDDTGRLHEHPGAEDEHSVSLKHNDDEVLSEHRDEREEYSRNYYKLNQKHNEWERTKQVETRKLQREQGKLQSKKKKTNRDKLKIDQLEDQIREHEKVITEIVGHEKPDYLDKYNIQVEVNSIAKFRGRDIETDLYYIPGAEKHIRIFGDDFRGKFYLYINGIRRKDKLPSNLNKEIEGKIDDINSMLQSNNIAAMRPAIQKLDELLQKGRIKINWQLPPLPSPSSPDLPSPGKGGLGETTTEKEKIETKVYNLKMKEIANRFVDTTKNILGSQIEVFDRSTEAYKRLEEIFSKQDLRMKYKLSNKNLEEKRIEHNEQRKEELSSDLQTILNRSEKLRIKLAQTKKKKEDERKQKIETRAERKVEREKESVEAGKKRKEKKALRKKTIKERTQQLAENRVAREKRHNVWLKDERKKKKIRAEKKAEREVRDAAREKEQAAKRKVREKKKALKEKETQSKKKSLIKKMDLLINEWEAEPERIQNADTFNAFSEFKSGDDTVKLEGDNNQYKVSTNGVISITTDCFKEALAKYYSSVSRIMDTQNNDKDLALELFGEHVLNTSRNTRKLMAELDKMIEVKMLENLDYSQLSIPFNSDFILKYEPQSDVFGIPPRTYDSTEVECQNNPGGKIGRKDLKDYDYKEIRLHPKEQEPIEEEPSEPGIDQTGANLITNSLDTPELNQPQMLPTRQEESKRTEIVETPIKVGHTYSQDLHPPEEKVIEGRNGVY